MAKIGPHFKTISASLSLIITACSVVFLSCVAVASNRDVESKSEVIVNVNIENQPLNEALRALSRQFSFDIKGIPIGNEVVNINLNGLPLGEALKKVLRGYNYVIIRPGNASRYIVMILNKSERTQYTPPSTQPTVATSPPPVSSALPSQAVQQKLNNVPTTQTRGKGQPDNKTNPDGVINPPQENIAATQGGGGTIRQQQPPGITDQSAPAIQTTSAVQTIMPPTPAAGSIVDELEKPPQPPQPDVKTNDGVNLVSPQIPY